MGPCLSVLTSHSQVLEDGLIDGNEADYQKLFIEERTLGAGEFGEVRLIREMTEGSSPLAVKILKKGVTFKDNTLYTPLKRDVLRGECKILKTLAGEHNCLKLHSLYESASLIYVVTEFCGGGEMMEYIVNGQKTLRTEDVSRIAFQLLDAVNHCHNHGIIHRDIKPENCMFKHSQENAPLRLIDFGSSTIDDVTVVPKSGEDANKEQAAETAPSAEGSGQGLLEHTTFAGSAFYISPEMFQKHYTCKTDLWSVGATLYVLVAGYPADELQKAFNHMQTSKERDLRDLPNMPEDMPDSYIEMLNDLLTYRHTDRKSASQVLESEFVQFHKQEGVTGDDEEGAGLSLEEISKAANDDGAETNNATQGKSTTRLRRTKSIVIDGSVQKHKLYLGYQKFERSVTTLLATILKREEYHALIEAINNKLKTEDEENQNKLRVIKVSELRKLLESLKYERALTMMDKLPDAENYTGFAYHTSLLKDFDEEDGGNGSSKDRGGTSLSRSTSADLGALGRKKGPSDNRRNTVSVHGNSVFDKFKAITSRRFQPYYDGEEDDPMNRSMHGALRK